MKIMSFNTEHCLSYKERNIDFALMADTIKICGADIVGLNEMRNEGPREDFVDQTKILSELTGLPHFYFAKAIDVDGCNPYGNAILSRYPITHAETIMVPDPPADSVNERAETRCLLKAKLENGLTVLVIHFGLNHSERVNAVRTVLENMEKTKCILMGDFNAVPDDSVLNPIKECMKDAAEVFVKPLLSHPSDNPNRKIDYIFVTPDIEVASADIPAIVASDHRPHTAEIHM